MDKELQKLIHQLRDEKCPPAALDRVAERISLKKTRARSLRSSLAWAVSVACLLGTLVFRQWHALQEARMRAAELAAKAQVQANRDFIVLQTQEAFAYIGQALIRATAHTEKVLLKEAVPPLRNGFETVKNKVTKPI